MVRKKKPPGAEARERQNLLRILHQYGITPSQYRLMLRRQDNRCAICRRLVKLTIDHCHSTQLIRGLLCSTCNSLLGMAGDSPRILAAAIVYLEEHGIRYLSGAWEEAEG